jgi:uncharacterized protein (DUF305 family)
MSQKHTRMLVTALAVAICMTPVAGRLALAQGTQPPIVRSSPASIAQARADSARYPYTKADIDFMTGMIGHHAQAIEMSKWAPTHGANPAVQRLAARIINAQTDEITNMQMWLRDRNQPVSDGHGGMAGMDMSHGDMDMSHDMMPGMLTPAQMKQLEAARGPEFDRLFLTFMIQHHYGAVKMVQTLFDTYGAGQDQFAFKFASDANIDQTTEIARMEQMLVLLPASK